MMHRDMTIHEITDKLFQVFLYLKTGGWVMLVTYLVAGLILARIVRKLFLKLVRSGKMPLQVGHILSKFVVVIIWMLAGIQALRSVGVDLVGILGAAGVAGVAIGFASQTALSNLISGIFLITERSFSIGDYVRVGDHEGTVESLNLLSIYIRQADNALIRIPCESIIKNAVVNFTHNGLRRCDFEVGVDYSTDLAKVQEVVLRVVNELKFLPDGPAPAVQFLGFADSALTVKLGIWCNAADYHHCRYTFAKALMSAFGQAGISIPFPIRDVRLNK